MYVPAELTDLLAEHIAEHCPRDDPHRWLFRSNGNQPAHQNTVGHQWRKACDAAGLVVKPPADAKPAKQRTSPRLFTLHDLRHFYASGLIASGCNVVTVQRALGHAKPTTTLNTYSHLWHRGRPHEVGRRSAHGGLSKGSCGLCADC